MTAAAGRRAVRGATEADAEDAASLLRRFNAEYGDPAPSLLELTGRVAELLAEGATTVLLAGDGPDGLALLRFRTALWSPGLECYLAELYVVPERRGQGLGRALLDAAIDDARARGADTMDLGTSEADTVARGLYERSGFVNREHPPDGPLMYVYERNL